MFFFLFWVVSCFCHPRANTQAVKKTEERVPWVTIPFFSSFANSEVGRKEYSEQCTEAAFAGKATAGWWCWSLVWSFSPPCGNWRLQAYVGKWTDLFLAQAMGPFISWDFPQAFRFLCFAASRQVCKGSLGRNAVLLEFGLWKHMFAFAKR